MVAHPNLPISYRFDTNAIRLLSGEYCGFDPRRIESTILTGRQTNRVHVRPFRKI